MTVEEKRGLKARALRYYAWGDGHYQRSLAWIEAQDPVTRRGATISWFRRYREADGQLYAVLLAAYLFLSVIPAILVESTFLENDPSSFAQQQIDRLGLTGTTADLLHSVFVGASQNKLGSTLIAIANLVVFGLGIGRVLQLAHGRVWRQDVRAARLTDQVRYVAIVLAIILMFFLYALQSQQLAGKSAWIGIALAPFWLVLLLAFFVWVPRLLLHDRVPIRAVLPGAVLSVLGLVGLRLLSAFLLVRWLNWYSQYYGGIGIFMALLFWLILGATVLMFALALSPVLAVRRELAQAGRADARVVDS